MRIARVMGGIGRTLIGAGVLLLLFVAYQLWGTGIHAARAQDRLTRDFERALESFDDSERRGGSGSTRTAEPPPPPLEGDAVAIIRIPSIDVTRTVVEGVSVADLKEGPGHYPQTPMPGQAGNAAIAGHRTTYGAPFYRLDELDEGEEILVQTLQGEFRYVVESSIVVRPDQSEVLAPTDDARLTLTTCEPRYSARKRLIVTAILEDEPARAPTTTSTTTPEVNEERGDAEESPTTIDGAGLSGDPAARWPTFWWALGTALIGFAIWLASKRWRPLWVYAGGAPVFLVVLFVFYENVSRLLPANI